MKVSAIYVKKQDLVTYHLTQDPENEPFQPTDAAGYTLFLHSLNDALQPSHRRGHYVILKKPYRVPNNKKLSSYVKPELVYGHIVESLVKDDTLIVTIHFGCKNVMPLTNISFCYALGKEPSYMESEVNTPVGLVMYASCEVDEAIFYAFSQVALDDTKEIFDLFIDTYGNHTEGGLSTLLREYPLPDLSNTTPVVSEPKNSEDKPCSTTQIDTDVKTTTIGTLYKMHRKRWHPDPETSTFLDVEGNQLSRWQINDETLGAILGSSARRLLPPLVVKEDNAGNYQAIKGNGLYRSIFDYIVSFEELNVLRPTQRLILETEVTLQVIRSGTSSNCLREIEGFLSQLYEG